MQFYMPFLRPLFFSSIFHLFLLSEWLLLGMANLLWNGFEMNQIQVKCSKQMPNRVDCWLCAHLSFDDIKEILWAGSVCVFSHMHMNWLDYWHTLVAPLALSQELWKLEFLVALKSLVPSFPLLMSSLAVWWKLSLQRSFRGNANGKFYCGITGVFSLSNCLYSWLYPALSLHLSRAGQGYDKPRYVLGIPLPTLKPLKAWRWFRPKKRKYEWKRFVVLIWECRSQSHAAVWMPFEDETERDAVRKRRGQVGRLRGVWRSARSEELLWL